MDLGLPLLLMSTVPPAFLSLRVRPTTGEQQPAVAQLTTGLGWLCHLTIFRPTLLLLKISYHLPERGQLRAVFGLLTQADGRESMVQGGECSAGGFLLQTRQLQGHVGETCGSPKYTAALQSSLPHFGLGCSPQSFLLPGIVALYPLKP